MASAGRTFTLAEVARDLAVPQHNDEESTLAIQVRGIFKMWSSEIAIDRCLASFRQAEIWSSMLSGRWFSAGR
jgi:hypothetical protein